MASFDCPGCSASLDSSNSSNECPFCGEVLDNVAAESTPDEVVLVSAEQPAVGSDLAFAGDLTVLRNINVIQHGSHSAVLEITGGARANFWLIFAAFWNGISWPVCVMFVLTPDDAPWFAMLLLGLFVAAGAGMLYVGIRMKFGRTLVLLESERFSVQTILFGWKSTKQFVLNKESRASLELAYEQNDEPVYRVEVNGSNGKAKLATSLSYDEKKWLAENINRFLHGNIKDDTATASDPRVKGSSVVGEIAEPLDPAAYVDNGIVRVHGDADGTLHLSWKPLPPGKFQRILTIIAVSFFAFSAIAIGIFIGPEFLKSVSEKEWFSAAFRIPFLLAFSMPSLLALIVTCGRVYVRLDKSQVGMGGGLFFVRYLYHRPLTDIKSVLIADPLKSTMCTMASRTGKSRSVTNIPPGCVVKLADIKYPIPLTVGHSQQVAADVGGMIRYHLDRCGISLSNQKEFE